MEGKELQVSLLSRALRDLRTAKEQPQALRLAAIHYFKDGISNGFAVEDLLKWLFLWPDNRWSVFAQLGFSGKAGQDFVGMIKGLTLEELGVDE